MVVWIVITRLPWPDILSKYSVNWICNLSRFTRQSYCKLTVAELKEIRLGNIFTYQGVYGRPTCLPPGCSVFSSSTAALHKVVMDKIMGIMLAMNYGSWEWTKCRRSQTSFFGRCPVKWWVRYEGKVWHGTAIGHKARFLIGSQPQSLRFEMRKSSFLLYHNIFFQCACHNHLISIFHTAVAHFP